MDRNDSISAVIISYHGMDFLPDCLRTLTANLSDYPHEIIVIDNNSIDGSIEFIESEYPDIRLIKNKTNAGFARAINQGIEAAQNEFIWLLNQDLRFRDGCLDTLLECHESIDTPGMIGPRLVGFDGQLQKFCRRFPRIHTALFEIFGLAYMFPSSRLFNGWKMGDFDHLSSRRVPQPMGAAMLLHRSRIEKIGAMDESFGIFFNDVDFCERLQEAGFQNYYCYEAEVEHFQGGSVKKQRPKMIWLSHLGMFSYFKKVERKRQSSSFVKLLRLPLLYLTGLLLILSAIPRSLYHSLRKLI